MVIFFWFFVSYVISYGCVNIIEIILWFSFYFVLVGGELCYGGLLYIIVVIC